MQAGQNMGKVRVGLWESGGRGATQAAHAHHKHFRHVCDLGRVEARRLVEGMRALPSRKGGHTKLGEVRAGRREGAVGGGAAKAACREGLGWRSGRGYAP